MKFHKFLAIASIVILGLTVYSNSFLASFQLDDNSSIIDNPAIRNIGDFSAIWNYLPRRFILYLSLAFNYHFSHLNVMGYHIFNIVVHIMAALLVWWLMRLTLLAPAMKEDSIVQHRNLISLLVAFVFVSHPLQTASVTYIVQRAASIATLFYLASLCFYVQSRLWEEKGRAQVGRSVCYVLSFVFAVLAMFCKETAITLPLMLVLYEIVFLKKKNVLNIKSIVFLLLLLVIPLTIKFTESEIIAGKLTSAGISPLDYFLTQLRVIITYIRLAFVPINQNIDYDYHVSRSLFEWPTCISALALGAIFFFATKIFLKYRLVSFAILWFFVTLLPESSFLPLADVIFEHRLYLPLVGYSIFLVSGLFYICGRSNLKTMVKILITMIMIYSFLTYQRNKVWKSELSLWSDAVLKSPHKARVYSNRGVAYGKNGKFQEAIADLSKSIEIQPGHVKAYSNLGYIYYLQGDFVQALQYYNKAIALDPDFALAYWYRGVIYEAQGNFSASHYDFNKAIKINPVYEENYRKKSSI